MKNFGVCADHLIKLQPPQTQKEEACCGCQLQSLRPAGHLCTWRDISLTESGLATERPRGRCRVSSGLYFPSLDMCLEVKTTLFKKLDKIRLA